MFFHIDETGNTGLNLFDENQPTLSYGVLSSALNVDAIGKQLHTQMLDKLGVEQLHATEQGISGLETITPELFKLQNKLKFRFDMYHVHKPAYALVVLFDSVFDAGINPAVSWDWYWTPLRFPLIYKLASLMDKELLQEAWQLCIAKKIENETARVVSLLEEIRNRAQESDLLDQRSKEIIADGVSYGIQNPSEMDFGMGDPKLMSPNAVGFQFVVTCLARRCRKGRKKGGNTEITVDRQQQFNKVQAVTHFHQSKIAEAMKQDTKSDFRINHPLYEGIEQDDITLKGLPDVEPTFSASGESIGLQIVDIYLWITRRWLDDQELSPPLVALANAYLKHSTVDSISIEGMMGRWEAFEQKLPAFEDITDEQLEQLTKKVDAHREKIIDLGLR